MNHGLYYLCDLAPGSAPATDSEPEGASEEARYAAATEKVSHSKA